MRVFTLAHLRKKLKIYKMSKVYVIAEIGPNHNGDVNIALKMIDDLSNSDVDAIKFQLTKPKKLYSKDSFKANYQKLNDDSESAEEMSRKNQLNYEEHKLLYEKCKSYEIDYLCTAFDLESLKFLNEKLDIKYFKIPSGEILSIDLLDYISKFNKPVILSTGMSTYDEIKQSVNLINSNFKKNITILHCISNYPAEIKNVNLKNITKIQKLFDYPVGFSDHTLGNECSIASVALGSKMIEKHVTFDKSSSGPDHKASCNIDEFKELVKQIRKIENALGVEKRVISDEEQETLRVARKSIVSTRDLKVGEIIKRSDLCFKRPGTGISPIEINEVIGKKMIYEIPQDTVIKKEFIS